MSINFENISSRMSPETLNEQVLAKAYKKAQEKIENERIHINPAKFTDYSKKTIESDTAYVAKREKEIKDMETHESAEALKLATVLEEVLVDQIELNDWMGPDITTRKSSRYDDLANGVDEIVEMHEPTSVSYLALAIDVTYSPNRVRNKLQEIKKHIDSGELTTIKYFESSDETIRGRLSKVPHVVIGIDHKTIMQLAKMWVERDNKALAAHPVQLEILDEIMGQLNAFRDYAEKTNQADLVNIYERQISIIQKIRSSESKTELRKKADLSYRTEDRLFLELKKELGLFGQ